MVPEPEKWKQRTAGERHSRNHVAELEALAAQPIADWRAEVQIRYALAKEYEDLAEYAKSFEHLRRGAQTRREHLRYDVAAAGPDRISVGALTHSAPVLDLGLDLLWTTAGTGALQAEWS